MALEVMDLRTRIGRVEVNGFIGNAPGPRKDEASWLEVAATSSPVVWIGSLCLEGRLGNFGNVFWDELSPLVALNSLGLPCLPPEEYLESIEKVEATGKHVVVDVAGFHIGDFAKLAKFFWRPGRSICLNMGCPNIGGHKPFTFDIKSGRRAVEETRDVVPDANLIVTVSAHPDTAYHDEWARVFQIEEVDAIRACNTIGLSKARDRNLRSVIDPNRGLAGLSGEKIREIVQGQIAVWHNLFPNMSIVATGGISQGWHLVHHLADGADFGLTATKYAQREGARCLDRIQLEAVEEMEKLELHSLADIKARGATS